MFRKRRTIFYIGGRRETRGGVLTYISYTGNAAHANGLLFHQKSLDMGPILVKKSLEKIVKSAVFMVKKPLEMGSDLRKFRKNPVKSAVF